MEKKNTLTKILAIAGTVLAWLPLLAPLAFGLFRLFRMGMFRFDYLMPAELFPAAFLGDILLIWAAFRARRVRGLIYWSVAASILLLVGSQALAVVTGLASGVTEPAGLAWASVVACLVLFILAMLAVAVGGALLVRDLFKSSRLPAESL